MIPTIKPCPFCGKTPVVGGAEIKDYYNGEWSSAARKEFWIIPQCSITCIFGTTHARAFKITDGIRYKSPEGAINAWNNRVDNN